LDRRDFVLDPRSMIAPLIVDTTSDPRLVVVVLHGRAMRAGDLAPFANSIGVPARFMFPQAPLPCPGGGYTWWPIDEERRFEALQSGPRDLAQAHPEGRPAARAGLAKVLHEARLRAPDAQIALVGFSQGGMLAVDTLLHEPIRIDALALLSSSCIALDEWRARWSQSRTLHELPVLVTHGRADSDLALSAGERLRDELRSAGAAVQWLAFDGGHEIPLQVWRQLRKMLNAVLANSPDIIRR
jgi:phospholipase/carboxylesterase